METNKNVQEKETAVKQEEVNNVANDPKTTEQPKAEENKEEKTKTSESAGNLKESAKEFGKKHKKELIATGIGAAIGATIMYFFKKKD